MRCVRHESEHISWGIIFYFSVCSRKDLYLKASYDYVKKNGVDFNALPDRGIEPKVFAKFLQKSGLLGNEAVTWITFQG